MKLRQGAEGDGVAILTHSKVKTVHLKEFDVDGLEAIWADVQVGKVRGVVGSVYIPPGDTKALDLLDNVIQRILQIHHSIIVSMDANARSSLCDNGCIGVSQYCPSI